MASSHHDPRGRRRSRTIVAPRSPRCGGAGAKPSTCGRQSRPVSQSGSASRRTAPPELECRPIPWITSTDRNPRALEASRRRPSRLSAASWRIPCRSIRSPGAGSPRPRLWSCRSLTPGAAARHRSSGSGQRKGGAASSECRRGSGPGSRPVGPGAVGTVGGSRAGPRRSGFRGPTRSAKPSPDRPASRSGALRSEARRSPCPSRPSTSPRSSPSPGLIAGLAPPPAPSSPA